MISCRHCRGRFSLETAAASTEAGVESTGNFLRRPSSWRPLASSAKMGRRFFPPTPQYHLFGEHSHAASSMEDRRATHFKILLHTWLWSSALWKRPKSRLFTSLEAQKRGTTYKVGTKLPFSQCSKELQKKTLNAFFRSFFFFSLGQKKNHKSLDFAMCAVNFNEMSFHIPAMFYFSADFK